MTRRDSIGDLERAVEDLEETHGTASFNDYQVAVLNTLGDADDLTAEEERLLEDPERHLSAAGKRDLRAVEDYIESEVQA